MKTIYTVVGFLLCISFSPQSQSQSWHSLGTGTTGTVHSVQVFGNLLIAASEFTNAGGTTVSNIAAWNGTSWTTLGSGVNGPIYAMTIFNNNLIVGGKFTSAGGITANNVASWNGTTWSALGLGTNDTVFAFTIAGTSLRAGGSFTSAGGVVCNRLALWNGTTWSSMPGSATNGVNNTVYALTVSGSDIFIGGRFTQTSGGLTVNRITRYNIASGTYFALGTGIDNNSVLSLLFYSNQLYVGGNFSTIGGLTVNNLARWTGSNWNTVSTGTNGAVKSMSVSGTNLIIGGTFTNAGAISGVNGIASWNGTTFSALGNGISGSGASVNGITTWSNVIIAGGSFTTAGGTSANNIAAYGSIPVAPTLISPPDGSTGVSLTPTLDWSDVTGATTYGVQVSTNANFTSLVVNQSGLTTSQYTVGSGTLSNNTTYFWRANATNGLGTSPYSLIWFFTTGTVGIINQSEIPLAYRLYQNYPNPFNSQTIIRFDLPGHGSGKVILSLYDFKGSLIREILTSDYVAGKWEVRLNAQDLASGVYIYKLQTENFSESRKFILIK